jgi:hypothetical protein
MQKPLRQFTKCSSLTTLVTVFVIMFSLSSTALTTFGIGKPQSNPPVATAARKYSVFCCNYRWRLMLIKVNLSCSLVTFN